MRERRIEKGDKKEEREEGKEPGKKRKGKKKRESQVFFKERKKYKGLTTPGTTLPKKFSLFHFV